MRMPPGIHQREEYDDLCLLDGLKLTDRVTGGGRRTWSHGAADTPIGGNLKIRVGVAAVFGKIETFHFFFRRDPQADGFVDQFEHKKCGRKDPQKAGADAQQLDADDFGRGSTDVEYAGCQGAPGTADAVYGNGADRIIHLDFVKETEPKAPR